MNTKCNIYFCFIVLLLNTACAQSKLIRIQSKLPNPGNLNFYFQELDVHQKNARKKPLVVVLHGCGQSAETIAIQSGWDKLARENDFYVLYPQQKLINNTNLCFNWFNAKDVSSNNGEACSIKNMILQLSDSLAIDKSKIFIYGVSAGAAMSVAMMALYPEIFKAGASFAGAPFGCANNFFDAFKVMTEGIDNTPEQWSNSIFNLHKNTASVFPKLIVIHGTTDKVVNIKNSYELIEQWTSVHHSDTIADEKLSPFGSNNNVERITYTNTLHDSIVIFYKINSLGHALAVDPGDKPKQGGETGLFSSDVNFFSTWYIARDFGLILFSDSSQFHAK